MNEPINFKKPSGCASVLLLAVLGFFVFVLFGSIWNMTPMGKQQIAELEAQQRRETESVKQQSAAAEPPADGKPEAVVPAEESDQHLDPGETGTIPIGTIIFADRSAIESWLKARSLDDKEGEVELLEANRVSMVTDQTDIRFLESTLVSWQQYAEVRILSGPGQGSKCWVYAKEMKKSTRK